RRLTIFFILIEGTFLHALRINEWANVKLPRGVDKMNGHGGCIWTLTILLNWIVRSEKTGGQYHNVQKNQGDQQHFSFARSESHGAHCPNPRVHPEKQNVCDKVSRDKKKSRKQDAADDHIQIPRKNGFQKERTKTRPTGNHLD